MKPIFGFFKNQPKIFYFLFVFISSLIIYTLYLFIYLKIIGIYGVAMITGGASSSEGNDYKYEFIYEGEKYTGSFSGLKYEIGSKYFVLFSPNNPDKNLLDYNEPVPNCLEDSINSTWEEIPKCDNTN